MEIEYKKNSPNSRYDEEEEVKTPYIKPKSTSNQLSLTEKCQAYTLNKSGESYRSIAKKLQRSSGAVNNLLQKAQSHKSLDNQHSKKGRFVKGSSKLTEHHKKFILQWITHGKHRSSNEIWLHLTSIKTLQWVCYDVVNNYLKSLGKWVRPRLKTVISQKNLIHRRDYCIENINSIENQDILFTDESLFELNRTTAKVFKFKKESMPEIEKLSTWVRVMVWAGVSLRGKTKIHFVEGWINNQKYIDLLKEARRDILDLYDGDDFFFLQDNARPHRHPNSMRYIRRWISSRLKDHPAQSPDLNPIELVWGRLKNMVELCRPRNKEELKNAIIDCWEKIPMNFIRSCILGLRNKMEKAIENANLEIIESEEGSNSEHDVSEEENDSSSESHDSIGDGFDSEDSSSESGMEEEY